MSDLVRPGSRPNQVNNLVVTVRFSLLQSGRPLHFFP